MGGTRLTTVGGVMTRTETTTGSAGEEGRWRGHPIASVLVRGLALVIPVGAGVGVAVLIASMLGPPTTGPATVGWWVAVLGCSTLAAWLTDRAARRLLPLAALLKLTLVFPDRAPSRYTLARAAGNTRLLERRVRQAREEGVSDDPTRAAEMVLSLVAALSAHDRRTRGHSERVRAFVDLLADQINLDADARARLRWSALLHDIGKLQVGAEILNKPSKLEEDEWASIRAHPEAGARLAAPLLPWLGEWGRAIVDHHERFDGTGYPEGRSGHEISLAGRITGIADSFETMTAARAYKKPMSVMAARRELTRCADIQFDPALVRAFLNVSIGRLMWTIGPMTWLGQIPLVRKLLTVRPESAAAASPALAKTLAGIVALGMSGTIAPHQQARAGMPDLTSPPALLQEAVDPSTYSVAARDTAEESDRERTKGSGRSGGSGKGGGGNDSGGSGGPAEPGPGGSEEPGGGDTGGGGGDGSGGPIDTVTDQVDDAGDAVDGAVDTVTDVVDDVVDDVTGSLPPLPGL